MENQHFSIRNEDSSKETAPIVVSSANCATPSKFIILFKTSSFLTQNSPFLIQNSSFWIQNSWFWLACFRCVCVSVTEPPGVTRALISPHNSWMSTGESRKSRAEFPIFHVFYGENLRNCGEVTPDSAVLASSAGVRVSRTAPGAAWGAAEMFQRSAV